jgi:hypothetical protein
MRPLGPEVSGDEAHLHTSLNVGAESPDLLMTGTRAAIFNFGHVTLKLGQHCNLTAAAAMPKIGAGVLYLQKSRATYV